MRRMPKPRIQVLVCTNEREAGAKKPSCGPRGALELYRSLKDKVWDSGVGEDVMVVRTGCLKHCSRGTVVAIQPYNLWYQKVRLEDLDEIVEKSILGEGQEVERLSMPDIPWE